MGSDGLGRILPIALGRGFAVCTLLLGAGTTLPSLATGEELRVYGEGEYPSDVRLGGLRTLNSGFPFAPVSTPEEWAERSAALRRRVQVATGLWPMPTRTPLRAVVHGKVNRPDYTVEKVILESVPGHFVTGNLYRPRSLPGPHCVVLSPHGHTGTDAGRRDGGRFHEHTLEQVRQEIASGAERFEIGGRPFLQARAVQLARMGCVVFQYDMVGYADSLQLGHRSLGVRQRMSTAKRWGLSSPQAELNLQSLMGLQTWNSVRALDFLLSQPDLDLERVAVEGHSGGGTQTFMLAAIDDRPRVLFPAVMVSTGMQGGCLCENASLLRVGAGNVDIAALTAPRPLGMTGANDWTIEIETKGLPDLEALYTLLGAEGLVAAQAFPQFDHNYNSVSRTVMYNWLNTHLGLGAREPVIEEDYRPLSREEASVWTAEHPAPTGEQVGDTHERDILEWMTQDSRQQMEELHPTDAPHLEQFREVVGGAFDTILVRRLEDVEGVSFEPTATRRVEGATLRLGLLRNDEQEELPAAVLEPVEEWNREVVLWIHEDGWHGLFDAKGEPVPEVRRLLGAGFAVAGLDLLFQGELRGSNLDPEIGRTRARLMCQGDCSENWQSAGVFTFGYNPALFAGRVHDVLTAVRHFREDRGARVTLVGLGPVAGPVVIAARAQSGEAVQRLGVDTGGFRFSKLERVDDPMFLPGAAKYLDLPGLLALGAGGELWLGGEGNAGPPLVVQAYRAAGRPEALHVHKGRSRPADVAAWVIDRGR